MTSSQPTAPTPRRPGLRRGVAVVLCGVAGLALLVALALGGAWWWSGSEGSLAQTLRSLGPGGLLYRLAGVAGLPQNALGTLDAREVTGSLRHGGHLGELHWQQDGPSAVRLDASGVQLDWQALALRQGLLQIDALAVKSLTLTLPASTEPAKPLESLVLPLPMAIRFAVEQLQVKGATELQLSGVRGQYGYGVNAPENVANNAAGDWHQLRLDALNIARGQYQGQLRLQALAPMALQAQLTGLVGSQVPGGAAVSVTAQADIQGQLSGADAALAVQAHVQPVPAAPAPPTPVPPPSGASKVPGATSTTGPVLDATARLLPWASQPVHSAELTLARFNLADFWPQAPATALSGTVNAQAAGTGWHAQLDLRNARPGPWDQQQLPVQSLQASVQQAGTRWTVSALKAHLGDGDLQGQGHWQPGDGQAPWQGDISFTGVNPAALYSTLARSRLDGQLRAQAQAPASTQAQASASSIAMASAFEFTVSPGKGRDALPAGFQGLALGKAHGVGVWQGDTLSWRELSVQAAQASLQSTGVLHLASRGFSGTADLSFPGGSASFKGDAKAGATKAVKPASAAAPPLAAWPAWLGEAQGELRASLTQADLAWAWLKSLPAVPGLDPALRAWAIKGRADLRARWPDPAPDGGAAKARLAQAQPTLHAQLDAPTLQLQAPPDAEGVLPAPLQLSSLRLQLDGPLSALVLDLGGTAEQGPWRAVLGSQATISLASPQVGAAVLSRFSLNVQDSARSLAWALQPDKAEKAEKADLLQLRWADNSIELLPGALRLSPQDVGSYRAPRNEAVTLSWQQLLWDAQGLRTQGRLSQFSLAWVDWLAGPQAQPLADLGLSGQMMFDGDWDVRWPRDTRTPVRISAGLQHRSGDLRLALDDSSAALPGAAVQQVSAGLREASLRVSTESQPDGGMALRTRLRWNSERAGTVQADVATLLQASSQGWSWPATAGLRGSLSAQLPQIGVWSLLAPPGWRMQGTLAAQATLSGTRAAPQWQGQVQADKLALRSVVDGIEFVNGQLRATLAGDKLLVERFALEGAGGAKTGGQLAASGAVQWSLPGQLAQAASTAAAARRVPHIDLQLTLDKLRVSSRADRRLVVSGQVQAKLVGAALQLRGKLRADQASFALPEEFTPTLGSDVVVRGRQTGASSPTPGASVVLPDVQLDLDLGNNFAVQGMGLKARLEGTLQVRSTPEQPVPRLLGEVRTTSGTYRAYGVNLNLETGLLRFAGPYDNPSLDILAIRPNISQRAGVQVTGTAQVPVVRLYAEPELPDTEKLSWVVLGRSATGPGGDAAILQQAALSLLGRPGNTLDGGLAKRLGLDELSYRSGGVNADGTVTTAAVSLGKRLASNLYVVYGQSLTGSVGTVSILYELSRRLTLRAKAGEDNVLELIFTQRYD